MWMGDITIDRIRGYPLDRVKLEMRSCFCPLGEVTMHASAPWELPRMAWRFHQTITHFIACAEHLHHAQIFPLSNVIMVLQMLVTWAIIHSLLVGGILDFPYFSWRKCR